MENKDRALIHHDAVIEKLTHEVAILKRHKFAQRSEQLDAVQGNLLDELIDSDLAAIEAELAQLTADEAPIPPKNSPSGLRCHQNYTPHPDPSLNVLFVSGS
jgi:hypothetical protein